MKTFPTLYKKSSTGKIQEWKIYVEKNSNDTASYSTEFGYSGGQIQRTTVRIEKGKNLKKANETTPVEQAISEANSKFLKQKDKGYVEKLKDFDISLKPMLAHTYEDDKDKVVWPCLIQPKLDGCRCLTYKVDNEITMLSRQGKEFTALPHIREELDRLLPEGLILDGELYYHEGTFPERMSWIKRNQPNSTKIHLVVYDVLDTSLPYSERFEKFTTWLAENKPKYVKSIDSTKVKNQAELSQVHAQFVEDGYEGVIVRNGDCMYKPGLRSHDLLKLKQFSDAEYLIIGAEKNKGKMENQCTFILTTQGGEQFGCKCQGDSELQEWYWKNHKSLIGKYLTVKYFELSKDNIPRFPIGIKIKDLDLE